MKIHLIAGTRPLALASALVSALAILPAACGHADETAPSPAFRTSGVSDTATADPDIGDNVVTYRVNSALTADPELNGFNLGVYIRNGDVQLSGVVASRAGMERAIALAQGVAGVRKVENDMRLPDGQSGSRHVFADSLVAARVRSALLADRAINSAAIAITTHKGEVRLSGQVDSQAQMLRAIGIARNTEGAASVASEMSVRTEAETAQVTAVR